MLWQKLKSVGFQYLILRRVNQGALENFFGNVRQQGGNCINPTPIQFERAFRKLFTENYLHSETTNCTDDFDTLLTQLNDLQHETVFVEVNRTNSFFNFVMSGISLIYV
ncbi:hypothetical protein ABEB36_004602 [Hypothenemus hampei]|uniref:Transposable element P transposase-like RNase H C-terminal domain-containing protein n=1 Tax=Hypothenemus hampei TaxID=57062 RepID=A0ABD1F6Y6_HYPHA